MPLRRKSKSQSSPDDVVPSTRLSKMDRGDLHDCIETAIMNAGHHLSEWRKMPPGRDTERAYHMETLIGQLDLAKEATIALRERYQY